MALKGTKSTHQASSSSQSSTSARRLQLWEESRKNPDGSLNPPGHNRPLDRRNLRLAILMAPLVFKDLIKILWSIEGYGLVWCFLGYIIDDALPAWQAVTSAMLLDAVYLSLAQKGSIEAAKIGKLTLLQLVASNADSLLREFVGIKGIQISNRLSDEISFLYLKMQLSLDIPMLSDPRVSPIVFEAAVFAGLESTARGGVMARANPANTLHMLTALIRTTVALITHIAVLVPILLQNGPPTSLAGSIFLLLCFFPSIIELVSFDYPPIGLQMGNTTYKLSEERVTIQAMGTAAQYKQETLLFDLAGWILPRWQTLSRQIQQNQALARGRHDWVRIGLDVLKDSVQGALYFLTVTNVFQSASLSSIQITQSCARTLIHEISSLRWKLNQLIQQTCFAAAFLESLRLEDTVLKDIRGGVHQKDLIRYRPIHGGKGMKIEAINLSFTYPGQTRPALKNINLVIEPGETLAIVGLNGGGKSTLIKVLMGPYDCEGSLLINDVEARSYYRPSLHAHTTVCFQDFAKYTLLFRENVGLGGYHLLRDPNTSFNDKHDQAALSLALSRGGAENLVERLPNGIHTPLDPFSNPSSGSDIGMGRQPGSRFSVLDGLVGSIQAPKPLKTNDQTNDLTEKATHNSPSSSSPPPPKESNPPPPPTPRSMEPIIPSPRVCLSGGQWQRVALARAFMRSDEADLVVFDEPSASLDARAEHELFQRIHSLSCSPTTGERIRTTIFVSHRFSTTRRADKIAVVEDGTILEMGSHSDLMGMGGRYAELFNLQASGFQG